MAMWATTAHAEGPVSKGVQVRMQPGTTELLDTIFTGMTIPVQQSVHLQNISCFDELGVDDIDIELTVKSVRMVPRDHYLFIELDLEDIVAHDLYLWTDDPAFDGCPTMEWTLEEVSFKEPHLEARLGGYVQDGKLVFDIEGDPVVTGELDTDHPGFVDDVIVALFDDMIIEQVANAALAEVPPMLTEFVADTVLTGEYGDYSMELEIEEARLQPDKFDIIAAGSVDWNGEQVCFPPPATPEPIGRSPELDLGGHEDVTVAVGVTEKMLNDVAQNGYESGWWCLHSDLVEELLSQIQEAFDPEVGTLDASAMPTQPPVATIEPDGTRLSFQGLQFWVGPDDDPSDHVIQATVNMDGKIELGINQDLTSITLTLKEIDVQFVEWDVQYIISDREGAAERMRDFFEDWVIHWIEDQMDAVTLFAAQYHVWDLVLRVDDVEREPGGLKVFLDIKHISDPEVDLQAPDTTVNAVPTAPGEVSVEFGATDDREGIIAYSYRIDGGSWKVWNTETSRVIDRLDGGEHTIEVQSRDLWLNVDDTPAMATFTVEAVPEPAPPPPIEGCDCDHRGPGAPVGVLGLLALGLVRRRR